ncbi:MAG: peptidylprolyl isomerase [Thermodesulfobacteriota bacterium]
MIRTAVNKSLLLFLFIAAVMIATGPACAADEANEGKTQGDGDYVAVVGGKKIPEDTLDRKVNLIKNRYASMGQELDDQRLAELKDNILDNLIEKELLYQESQEQGVAVDSAEVQSQLDQIKNKFSDQEEFEKKIREMDYTEPLLKQQIRENLAIQALIDEKVAADVEISDEEIESYYESNKKEFSVPEKIKARHILIKTSQDAGEDEKAEAKNKIQDVQKKLKQDGDFAELAKEHSEGPSSKNGGDLGFFSRGQMVESFDEAAFALDTGEVSDIVQTRFGYHLIKVEDRKSEEQKPFAEVKDTIHQQLKQQQVSQELEPFIESLKQKYPIDKNLPSGSKE